MSPQKPPPSWGRETLPKLRASAGLTRERLAARSGIAEKTLRAIEAGRTQATHAQRQRLIAVLRLAKLCPAGVLLLPLADDKHRDVLRQALTDYATQRHDPAAFVARRYPGAADDVRARHIAWASDEATTAQALLSQLQAYS